MLFFQPSHLTIQHLIILTDVEEAAKASPLSRLLKKTDCEKLPKGIGGQKLRIDCHQTYRQTPSSFHLLQALDDSCLLVLKI